MLSKLAFPSIHSTSDTMVIRCWRSSVMGSSILVQGMFPGASIQCLLGSAEPHATSCCGAGVLQLGLGGGVLLFSFQLVVVLELKRLTSDRRRSSSCDSWGSWLGDAWFFIALLPYVAIPISAEWGRIAAVPLCRIQCLCADRGVCTQSSRKVRSRELQVLQQHLEFTEMDGRTQLTSTECIKPVLCSSFHMSNTTLIRVERHRAQGGGGRDMWLP